ncbi:metallo-dependent phosphatase [Brevundimonas phage AA]|uniref:Metallo-dependent phosphatase n=1 Tax=Brevundimonas phage AA TaxID=2880937 RepID=A0AAN0MNY2_9CAUD|nr:metallo-dependent phosphatase [Brevundimonas phage BC]UCR90878.1 metallo-dependent phosphatase [Brevundimonas phage AA]
MKNPSHEEILAVLPGKSHGSVSKAARLLREQGYTHVTPQLLRLLIAQMDQSQLPGEYDRATELVSSRNAKTTNTKLRRDLAAMTEAVGTKEALFDSLSSVVDDLNSRPPIDFKPFIGGQVGRPMTVELLLSDLQIGKLQPGYNTQVARKRLYEFGRAALFQIEQKASVGYRIEKIVLGLLGDIIESDKKHKNSARATDTGTAEQMHDAMVAIFEFVVEPLARLGIPLEVVGIAGNHDWDDHGMAMFRPGRDMLSYPLYRSMEYVTRRAGYSNVEWTIPDGSYAIVDFYGQKALYEHGVGVSVTEASMKAHKIKRSEQEKVHLTYFRMGDKHNVSSFNAGQFVVNGAFFGSGPGGEEYSSISGYSSVAAQWMGFHLERDDTRLSLYDSFTIQLDHIGE